MNWTEITIKIDSENTENAEAIAHMAVPYGIYVEDYSNMEDEILEIAKIDIIDNGLLEKDRSKTLIHIYISPEDNPSEAISFLKERYRFANIPFEIKSDKCVIEDWLNNWKKYFKPTPIGNNLLIRPIWEENYESNGRIVINLEPGLAFGTGLHETTRLCLELLEKYVKSDMSVLDVGCGSGILSVASLLLGAGYACGVDIDEMAVKTANENSRLNSVDSKFDAVCGDLTEKVSGKYDIITANIVADIIIKLIDDVENYMNRETIYIMSGIIDVRENDVKTKLKDKFEIIEEREEGGWIALAAKLR